jgi:hypothetical protein
MPAANSCRSFTFALAAISAILLAVVSDLPTLADAGVAGAQRPILTKSITLRKAVPTATSRRRSSLPTVGLPLATGVGANVQVSPPDGNVYSSINATYDPASSSNLLTVSDIPTLTQVGAFPSSDAGSTWSHTNPPLPTTGPNQFATEPATAYGSSGRAYVATVAATASSTSISTQLVVSASSDRGGTWTAPAVVESSARSPEKPMMTADPTSGAYQGRLYIAYDVTPSAISNPIVVASSGDGVHWHGSQVWDSGFDFGATPAIGPMARSM